MVKIIILFTLRKIVNSTATSAKRITQVVTIGKIDELDFLFDGHIEDKKIKAHC